MPILAVARRSGKPSGVTNTTLHFVKNQQDTVFICQITQPLQALIRHGHYTTLALHGLDQDGRGFRVNRRPHRVMIAKGHLVKAVRYRAKAFQMLFLPASGNGKLENPAKKGERSAGAQLCAPVRVAVDGP